MLPLYRFSHSKILHVPWPFLIVARVKFCWDHIPVRRFLDLKTNHFMANFSETLPWMPTRQGGPCCNLLWVAVRELTVTLCLSQGFVFSAHIALKSHCLLVILRWSWPVRKAASATYTGAGLSCLLTFWMLALSRSSCDGFTEEHAIALVQICEVTEHNSVSCTRKISSHTFG